MPTDKQPPKPKTEITDNDAERLIYEALRAEGAFVPQTPEEVAKAEEDFDDESVKLPASLRDPLAILKGKRAPRSSAAPEYLSKTQKEELADLADAVLAEHNVGDGGTGRVQSDP